MNAYTSASSLRRLGLRLALLSSTMIVVCVPVAAHAQSAAGSPAQVRAGQVRFNVPAQELDSALTSVADQGGIRIFFTSADLAGVRSNGVSGSMTVEQALSQVLTGSGFSWRYQADRTVVIERVPQAQGAIQLGPVRVEGSGGSRGGTSASSDPLITEGTSSYTTRAVGIGGKTSRDPREIQQSVSIMTAQRIQDQQLNSVEDALEQTTGVTTTTSFHGVSAFYSRGFEINNLQTDGGSPVTFNTQLFNSKGGLADLATYDHVEVLRGSDGLFAGVGNPSGTVNLVRKRPLDRRQIIVEALAGSWNRYRVEADITGPLAFDGKLRGRLVAAYDTRDQFYDRGYERRLVLYGVAEADLTEDTLLTVGLRYENKDGNPFVNGFPRYSNGDDLRLPRSTSLITNWTYDKLRTVEPFVKLERKLGGDWALKLNATQQRQYSDRLQVATIRPVDPFTLTGPIILPERYRYPNNQTLIDITLTGSFKAFGLDNEVLVGANWSHTGVDVDRVRYDGDFANYPFPTPVNVFNFRAQDYPKPTQLLAMSKYIAYSEEQSGFYAGLRSHITSNLQLVGGARYSEYKTRNSWDYVDAQTGAVIFESRGDFDQPGVWTPYGGLTLKLSSAISVYGSYAEIFQSQGGLVDVSGKQLSPITGASYEIGAKGSWLDGKLTAALATYRILRKGEGIFQPNQSGSFGIFSCCYASLGTVQSTGIDAELTGEILPGWELSAGYTYNENKLKSGYDASNGNAFFPQTPRHLFKLWTMVQMPGAWSRLRVGGGVNAQTKIYQAGSVLICNDQIRPSPGRSCVNSSTVPFEYTQGAYAIVSLRVEYRLNDRLSLAINARNIFDKTYYQTIGTSNSGNWYGEPRNVMVSVRGTW